MAKIDCDVDEIGTILDRDQKGQFLLLDIRQSEEYETGHIPAVTLIPRVWSTD